MLDWGQGGRDIALLRTSVPKSNYEFVHETMFDACTKQCLCKEIELLQYNHNLLEPTFLGPNIVFGQKFCGLFFF